MTNAHKEMLNTINQQGNANQNQKISYHLTPTMMATIKQTKTKDLQITSTGKDTEPSYSVGGNVKWYSRFGKQPGSSSKSEELAYDPAIPVVGIYIYLK